MAALLAPSGIGPPDPKAGRRPPQFRTSPIKAYGSSRLRVRPQGYLSPFVGYTYLGSESQVQFGSQFRSPDILLRYSRAPLGELPRFLSLL